MTNVTLLTPCLNPNKDDFIALSNSIKNQVKSPYEWIIIDGGSTEYIKNFINNICAQIELNIQFINLSGSNIYSALNFGIKQCKSEYYLTIGCDDILGKNALKDFSDQIKENTDIAFTNVKKGSSSVTVKKRLFKFINYFGATKITTNHSVGCFIKKYIHDELGLYDINYKYLADEEFFLKAYFKKYNFQYMDFYTGYVGNNGSTYTRRLECIFEHFIIINKTRSIFFLDVLILLFRLIKLKIKRLI